MSISNLNPFIRYARTHYDIAKQDVCSICYDCRLFYISQGSGYIEIEDIKYNMCEGTAIFIPSGKHYRFYFDNYSCLKVLIINFDLTDKFSCVKDSVGTALETDFEISKLMVSEEIAEFCEPIVLQNYNCICKDISGCIELFLTQKQFYRDYSSAIIKLCLLDMVKANNSTSFDGIVSDILDYIHIHFSESDLSNETIAAHFSYHTCYLNSLFKSATGMTIHQSIIKFRIQMAKNYLATTAFNIDNIAWKVGFNSSSYFIKAFRRETGTTPNKYKMNNIDSILSHRI